MGHLRAQLLGGPEGDAAAENFAYRRFSQSFQMKTKKSFSHIEQ
jgi:hypothetical protein